MVASSPNIVHSASGLLEGNSITHPPLFNGTNYIYQKNRMRNFMQATDIDCQRVIITGPIVPTKTQDDGRKITIPEAEYSDDDWKKI